MPSRIDEFSLVAIVRIRSFLAGAGKEGTPDENHTDYSAWLPFYDLNLQGAALQFVATRVLGLRGEEEDECVEVPARPGVFAVECRGARFGDDARVAGLRAYPKCTVVERGEMLKEIPVDIGGISVVDIATFGPAIVGDSRYERWLDQTFEDAAPVKLPQWNNIVIPTVDTGFGDGTYEVYSLRGAGAVVGLEAVFIREGDPYPFQGE